VVAGLRVVAALKRATLGHYAAPKTLMDLLLDALQHDPLVAAQEVHPRRVSVGINGEICPLSIRKEWFNWRGGDTLNCDFEGLAGVFFGR
jgi:hypothetical protein